VLREACTIALDWPAHLRIAVNVSPIQLRDLRIVDVVAAVLAETGLAPERLELEITESALMEGPTSEVLRSLKALGVRLALDDFGVGFSSLTNLQLFRFDKIKIDRSFVRAAGDQDKPCVVRGLATLARALGLETTAEGVETEAQLDIVRAEGCTEIQGFLFAKPAPARDLASLLLNSPARSRTDADQRRATAS
jgi:EAL domain-containing protein (putative c-di-GMP-specific phosphodiesterase class I)